MAPIKALVFDFGNVLCTWKPPKDSVIPPKQLKQIMSSDVWFDHERGRFSSEEECYAELETRFEIRSSDLASVMKMARASLKPQSTTLDFLADTKKRHPGLNIYGLTNTPRTEVDAVLSIGRRWPVFDHIYVSGNLGVRKPDICCFNTLIRSTGLPAESLVFVDDSPENVLAARSLGIHCILFQDHDQLCREIENVLGDPIERGQSFLRTNAKIMDSVTDQGVIIHDNFAQLLILDLTRDRDLVQLETWDRTWNYFIGVPQLTTEKFPNDLDTTSVALSVLSIDKKVVASVIDEMLEFRSADGIFMTYFDRTRPRVDHVVCTNILHLFCKNGRENEATATFDWVLDVLRNRAYLSGSRYYSSPDVFLYFLSRLTDVVRDQKRNEELRSLLPERIRERVGFGGDSISVATRLLASQNLGIKNDADFSRLLALQSADGGWPVGWVYKYGKSGLEIGNRGLSTALALKAIERHRVHDELPHQQPKEWWQAISFQRLWTLWPSVSRKSFSLSENLATGAHGW